MADKRMFSKEVIGSDTFLDLPVSSRELYFQLGMYADDDGFVSPKKVIRMVGASSDDVKVLIGKGFVIPFESGILVIKHWKRNNYIRADRYKPTEYQEELKIALQNQDYLGIPDVNQVVSQIRLDKIREDKSSMVSSFKKIMFYRKTGEKIVESPAGSGKLGIWRNGEFFEYADKKSEIEYK